MKLNGITFCVLAVVALVGAYFGKLSNPFLIDDNQTIVDSVEIESLADSWVPEKTHRSLDVGFHRCRWRWTTRSSGAIRWGSTARTSCSTC